jgi:hypothetical protein
LSPCAAAYPIVALLLNAHRRCLSWSKATWLAARCWTSTTLRPALPPDVLRNCRLFFAHDLNAFHASSPSCTAPKIYALQLPLLPSQVPELVKDYMAGTTLLDKYITYRPANPPHAVLQSLAHFHACACSTCQQSVLCIKT